MLRSSVFASHTESSPAENPPRAMLVYASMRLPSKIIFSLLFLLVAATSGCGTIQVHDPQRAHLAERGDRADCGRFFQRLDEVITESGVRDAEAAPIPGYPYLRVNRLLASFRDEVDDEGRFPFWVERLRELDASARRVEITNLPGSALLALNDLAQTREMLVQRVDGCAETLSRTDLAQLTGRWSTMTTVC